MEELLKARSLPETTDFGQIASGEIETPAESTLTDSFAFADSSDDHIKSLEEASSLLTLDELKSIAKEAKVQGKNKRELLQALRKSSQRQAGLEWRSFKRSETEESVYSEPSEACEDTQGSECVTINRDSHYLKKTIDITGPCIRLSPSVHRLFERAHLVFYRSTEWTEKSLTTIILAKISRRNFPEYLVSRSANIFPSRSALLEFEASIRTQYRIDFILEYNGTVKTDGLLAVKDVFEEVYPRWKTILLEEQQKEDRVYESGEGAYLRRFSPAWVYTRVVHKGVYVLGRFKEYEREHQILSELLEQRLFHAARRGAWYQRKALLEEHYMWNLSTDEGRTEDARKKHWKRIALETCEEGLQDRDCHLIYHFDLQKRLMKLEKALKVAKRQQHDFGHVRLSKPAENNVKGIRIEKTPPPGPSGKRRNSESGLSRKGAKTIWVDEREGGGECSVEAMCLSWYRDQGWKGFHSESGIVRTLVRLFRLTESLLITYSLAISFLMCFSPISLTCFKPHTRPAHSIFTRTPSILLEPQKSTTGSSKLQTVTRKG